VVVVSAPAGSEGRVDLERRVHHAERILHDRLSRLHDSISDELEESRVDDGLGGEIRAFAGRAVPDGEEAAVRVLVGLGVVRVEGWEGEEGGAKAGTGRAAGGARPGQDVALEEVGVTLEEGRRRLVLASPCEGGCTDEGGDVRGGRGGGVPAILLPALLV